MTKTRKRYRVTAWLETRLCGTVEAVNEQHAVALAKKLAEDGMLEEVPWMSELVDFAATEDVR